VFFNFYTRGCGCIGHPAFPTPSLGRKINAQLGQFTPRDCGLISQRHCEEQRDEAIHTYVADPWIASLPLAMTV
jgi:hypothetical protein